MHLEIVLWESWTVELPDKPLTIQLLTFILMWDTKSQIHIRKYIKNKSQLDLKLQDRLITWIIPDQHTSKFRVRLFYWLTDRKSHTHDLFNSSFNIAIFAICATIALLLEPSMHHSLHVYCPTTCQEFLEFIKEWQSQMLVSLGCMNAICDGKVIFVDALCPCFRSLPLKMKTILIALTKTLVSTYEKLPQSITETPPLYYIVGLVFSCWCTIICLDHWIYGCKEHCRRSVYFTTITVEMGEYIYIIFIQNTASIQFLNEQI